MYIDVHMKTSLIDVFLHAQACSNMLMLAKAILILWVIYMELRWLLILTLFFTSKQSNCRVFKGNQIPKKSNPTFRMCEEKHAQTYV